MKLIDKKDVINFWNLQSLSTNFLNLQPLTPISMQGFSKWFFCDSIRRSIYIMGKEIKHVVCSLLNDYKISVGILKRGSPVVNAGGKQHAKQANTNTTKTG